jgi:hypothetical protein
MNCISLASSYSATYIPSLLTSKFFVITGMSLLIFVVADTGANEPFPRNGHILYIIYSRLRVLYLQVPIIRLFDLHLQNFVIWFHWHKLLSTRNINQTWKIIKVYLEIFHDSIVPHNDPITLLLPGIVRCYIFSPASFRLDWICCLNARILYSPFIVNL